jgi:hypothetical protein
MDNANDFAPMGAMPEEIHRTLYGAPAPTTEPEAAQLHPNQPAPINPWSAKVDGDGRLPFESEEIEEAELDANPIHALFTGKGITTTLETAPRFRLSKANPTPAKEKTGERTYKLRKDESGATWNEAWDGDEIVSARLVLDPEEIAALSKKAPNDAPLLSPKLLAAQLKQIVLQLPVVADESAEDFVARLNAQLAELSARPSLSIL